MTTGMPELGSKISLISKADIRYEGRLFTVDPQECTIALASVRSFGTEDRDAQYPVPAQNQVYDYILFRGTDIKDIRVTNNVSHPQPLNDPAIMQLSVPPSLGGQTFHQTHPVLGAMGPQMGQFPGAYGGIGTIGAIGTGAIGTSLGMQRDNRGLNNSKPSELILGTSPQSNTVKPPVLSPTGIQPIQPNNHDLIGGSRSTTPASLSSRKSPTNDQGVQAGGSGHNEKRVVQPIQPPNQRNQQRRRSRERRDSRERNDNQQQNRQPIGRSQQNNAQYSYQHHQGYSNQHNQGYQQHYQQHPRGNWVNNRGPMRMRGRGQRGPGYRNNMGVGGNRPRNTLKFDNDYDFEQANTEFEELRSQLGKLKIDEVGSVSTTKSEVNGDVDKKDDSGNETGAGETEQEEDHEVYYDKSKSFFDKISCEAVERAKGKSQRTDWRVERKLNSETFGVAAARRGSYRGRGGFRGMGYRGGYRTNNYRQPQQQNQRRGGGPSSDNRQTSQQQQPAQQPQQQQQQDETEKDPPQENIHNDTDSVKQIIVEDVDLPPECSQVQSKSDTVGSVPEPAMAVK
ncbi:protein LSM14 homolog B isoform X2 [Diabrotica virgifera virgifera]|uniref:Protein LSM14 homolog B isoform X2 n=1 Tax=Diabrotica virgifera virgifera TaxID=50390 RepID=A0A6P7GE90_DIAVI|nr:protein LSM14 homolog B isoform X2 [Diabrotica virgifera virgifera]